MGTILVIDDEEAVLHMVELALKEFGYHVETAEDGNEGIKKFDSGFYDMVITDVCMPGMDGNDVVKHIRKFLGLH